MHDGDFRIGGDLLHAADVAHGKALAHSEALAYAEALALLRAKYPQYRAMQLAKRPLIRMRIQAVRSWGDLTPPTPG